ncbi:TM2 domain-containing protein [Colwellia sp. D2M02]|uniref:TM2 domain-containing protein n=1 Tax=Colwellia asteriadis TaxID=517723 RepID=A0ABN1LBB6_9GAMM|nr:TM2 domain-containing protein [Colwellia sp. D2M02]MBU2894340.1 TM2 domain-containing protein [Colwellia sp. D2M02]
MTNVLLKLEENRLREQISRLNLEQKRHYYNLEVENLKDPDTYAALNWLFVAGLHHFYLGKWKRGAINLGLMLLGCVFILTGSFIAAGIALVLLTFIIELPQLFKSQSIIHAYNNRLMEELLEQVDN